MMRKALSRYFQQIMARTLWGKHFVCLDGDLARGVDDRDIDSVHRVRYV